MAFGKLELQGLEATLKTCGQKFGFQILAILMSTRTGKGFNDLLREISDISPRTLSLRLKELEAKRLVSKNISMGPRVKIEYRITDRGLQFEKALEEMARAGSKL
ncbi:MAG: helix-turn-helix transcriptional regulator [Candidatus Diapherotrites archaeon]|uniref:Helix-turn-helix transcriptional regulator n=1 Tax=Candidatus Iainarchaeum sp. TaxID=3101447 RepID=A0A8T4LEJ3_9ARCH|nr:helix-turn-helix transcriptional regulator [Candidatus Diapherotrites archaeon]